MKLTDAALRNRTTVVVAMIITLLVGAYCYMVLPREAAPDIQIPYIIVTTSYEGVAPSDMETLVTLKIEKEIKGIKDIKEIRSNSIEGFSVISVEFEPGVDIDDALQKVRDKVNIAKNEIPLDADEPVVSEFNFSDLPIMIVNLTGADQVQLKLLADELEDRLEAIPGILNVNISGGLEREIRLEFDPDRLSAYGINPLEAVQAVSQNNLNIPSGSLELGEANYVVKVPGEFKDPAEINNIVIASPNGKPIYLLDVAKVVDGYKEPLTRSRQNQQPTVTLSILKRSGENVIRVSDAVKALLMQAEKQVPPGVTISYTSDQSKSIRMMVSELENSLLTGLILILIIITISLGLRDSLLVSLAIPYSLLIAFIILNSFGMTLNMIVLFSLTLSLGMLVDDAIVIVENMHRHHKMGKSRFAAAREAVREIGWPVVAATLTTIGAFFPMMFWPGIMGEFMGYLPKTVIIVLAASLVVALVINPCMATIIMEKKPHRIRTEADETAFLRFYKRFLRTAIQHRWATMVFAFGSLMVVIYWFASAGLGTEFFPRVEPERAIINVKLPEGSSLEASDAVVRVVEQAAAKYPEVKTIVANVGAGIVDSGSLGGGAGATNESNVAVEFVEREERHTPSSQIIELLRKDLQYVSGAEISANEEEMGPPTGKTISIEISGEDFETLGLEAARIRDRIRSIPGAVDVKDDYILGKPELQIAIDKEKAALLGLNTNIIGQMIRTSIQGTKAGVYRVGNDEYDVMVRLPKAMRSEVDTLSQLKIPNLAGAQIPLSSIANIKWASGLSSIRRLDQKRTVTISAEAAKGYNANLILGQAKAMFENYPLPLGYTLRFGGQNKEQNDAMAFLGKAFAAAVFLIALILVTEFNSLLLPLIIMTTVVLSLVGVFLGLVVTHMSFGIIMTGIGVVSLAGVVVKNGIVLVDYTEKLRDRGQSVLEAVVNAGAVRLRPVILTALTTILGVVPTAMGISIDFRKMGLDIGGESAQMWRPMAVATIFGLGTATMLTLIVVPSFYVILAPLMRKRHEHEMLAEETGIAEKGVAGDGNPDQPAQTVEVPQPKMSKAGIPPSLRPTSLDEA